MKALDLIAESRGDRTNVVADPNQFFKNSARKKKRELAKRLEHEDNPVAKAAGKMLRYKTDIDDIIDKIIVR